jgi:peroxiredoxin
MRQALLFCLVLLFAQASQAQEFTLKDTQGRVHHLSDYRGKWVLVNFWATWCPPCLEEIPDLIALHEAHKARDLVVLGVALDYASKKEVIAFAARQHITYPVVLGDYKIARQIGEIDGLPTSFLFDPAGVAVSAQSGVVTREDVEAYISSH